MTISKPGYLVALSWRGWIKGERRAGIITAIFRLAALAMAAGQIYGFGQTRTSIFNPYLLFIAVVLYSLVKTLHPLTWYKRRLPRIILIAIDIAFCGFLVFSTDGTNGPYLIFTITPVLWVALTRSGRGTFIVSVLTALYALASYLLNPFFPDHLTRIGWAFYAVYLVALFLCSTLPFMINGLGRQKLAEQSKLKERRRLLREIHDGYAQTAAAVRWQANLVSRLLKQKGIEMEEMKELESLAEKAQSEVRAPLDLLPHELNDGNFLPFLKTYLDQFSRQTGIATNFKADVGRLELDAEVEKELLAICREALTNVRKHSRANNAMIFLINHNKRLKITIADNGIGFEKNNHSDGHGMEVMRERAEQLGARLKVDSNQGKGTEVTIDLPVNKNWELARFWYGR